MGVDTQVLRFLLKSANDGLAKDSMLMLGRQSLHVQPVMLARILAENGFEPLALERDSYIEPLLSHIGFKKIDSIDFSNYELATIVHDLNQPIPGELRNAYSCVFESGTLEHVFNFPRAIQNCMEMVQVGGHYLGVTVVNNFMGHGFYQFSPELFFRIFSKENGYRVEELIVCEIDSSATWYRVADPILVGGRVRLINSRPTYMMIKACKTAAKEIFQVTPQQSDYVATWAGERNQVCANAPTKITKRNLPTRILGRLKRLLGLSGGSTGFDSVAFTKVTNGVAESKGT